MALILEQPRGNSGTPWSRSLSPEGTLRNLWSRSRTTQRTQDSRRRRVLSPAGSLGGLVRSPSELKCVSQPRQAAELSAAGKARQGKQRAGGKVAEVRHH